MVLTCWTGFSHAENFDRRHLCNEGLADNDIGHNVDRVLQCIKKADIIQNNVIKHAKSERSVLVALSHPFMYERVLRHDSDNDLERQCSTTIRVSNLDEDLLDSRLHLWGSDADHEDDHEYNHQLVQANCSRDSTRCSSSCKVRLQRR